MWSLAGNINFEVWEYGVSQRCSGLLLAVSGGPYVVLYPGMPGKHVTGSRLPSAAHKVLSSSLTFIQGTGATRADAGLEATLGDAAWLCVVGATPGTPVVGSSTIH